MIPKVSAGQKIGTSPLRSAASVNQLIEAANYFQQTRDGGTSETPTAAIWDTDLVSVQNLTGDNRLRGEVVQLGAYLLSADVNGNLRARNPWFEGNTVAAPVDQRIAILKRPSITSKITLAQMSGVCSAWVIVADVHHQFAEAVAGSYQLASCVRGPIPILTPISGTGPQEVFVLLGAPTGLIRFELSDELKFGTAPSGNNAFPLNWDGSAYTADTSRPFTVYDPFFESGGAAGYSAFTGKQPLSGQPGYQGWCVASLDSSRYEIVYLEHRAYWIEFTTTADAAKVSSLNQTANATVTDFSLGRDPDPASAGVTVYDPDDLFLHMLSGAKGRAKWSDENDRYEVVEAQSKAGEIAVTLSADMSSGSASATLASSAGQAGAFGTQQDNQSPTGTITVYDPWGSSGPFSIARSGAKALAIYDEKNDKYWLVECERLGILFSATLSGALSGGSTASVGTLSPASQWPFTQAPGSTPTVNNPLGKYASSGDTVLIYRDGSTYNIFAVASHQKNFVTGWSISGSNIVVTTSAGTAIEWDGTADTEVDTATGSCP